MNGVALTVSVLFCTTDLCKYLQQYHVKTKAQLLVTLIVLQVAILHILAYCFQSQMCFPLIKAPR